MQHFLPFIYKDSLFSKSFYKYSHTEKCHINYNNASPYITLRDRQKKIKINSVEIM